MNTTTLAALGIASAITNTAGTVPYIMDIFRHKTKPERATWWVWLLLTVIAFVAQVAAGATWSLFFTGATLLAIGTIAFLSVPYGYGTFHRRDLVGILIAIVGTTISIFVKSPLLALLIVVCVDFVGYWLTLTKTWEAPHTETLINWILASIAGLLGLLAVGALDVTRLIYPLYIFFGDGLMAFTIVYRRPRVAQDAQDI